MKVYLAGPINGCTDAEANDWRTQATELLGGPANVLDPMVRDYRGQEDESVESIVEGDKGDINDSDAVLAYCPKPSVGTSMEVYYSYAVKMMPVAVVVPEGAPVSPWLRYHSDVVVGTIDEAVEFLKKYESHL